MCGRFFCLVLGGGTGVLLWDLCPYCDIGTAWYSISTVLFSFRVLFFRRFFRKSQVFSVCFLLFCFVPFLFPSFLLRGYDGMCFILFCFILLAFFPAFLCGVRVLCVCADIWRRYVLYCRSGICLTFSCCIGRLMACLEREGMCCHGLAHDRDNAAHGIEVVVFACDSNPIMMPISKTGEGQLGCLDSERNIDTKYRVVIWLCIPRYSRQREQ